MRVTLKKSLASNSLAIPNSFLRHIRFVFFLVIFILLVNIPIVQNNINSLQKNELSVRNTYDFIQTVEHLLSLTKDTENHHRGYILTNGEEHLDSYKRSREEINSALNNLSQLTKEKSYLASDLENLTNLIQSKIANLDEEIELFTLNSDSHPEHSPSVSDDLGKEEMDEIRSLVSNIIRNEQYNLDHRKEVAQEQFRFLIWSLYFLTFLDIAVIFIAYHFLKKEVRKRHELTESLFESESQFRMLSENIPQMVWVTSADGSYLYSNPRWQEFTGLAVEDALGMGWTNAIHPDDVEEAKMVWLNALKTGEEYSTEYRVRNKEAQYRWQLVNVKPLKNSKGEITKWFGTTTDIHDYKMALEELRLSEAKFRKFVDANMIGVVFFELDGRVNEANDAFLDIIGITREEFNRDGLDLFEYIAPEHQKDSYIGLSKLSKIPTTLYCEKEYIRKDGVKRPTMIGAVGYQAEDGHYAGMAFALDISERKNAEAAIANANKAKSQFLATMSHEIRTPLGVIAGFVDLAMDPNQTEDDRKNALIRIKKNTDLLSELVNDILDLSKIEADKLELDIRDTETIKFLNDLSESMSIKAKEKGLRIQVSANTSVPPVFKTDQLRLKQILYNVIGNAIKFTDNGEIIVNVSYEKEQDNKPVLKFLVKDTGIGITKEQASKLFKPFSQADSSTTRKYGGTGLGLVLSKKLTEALGGDLRLVSSEPGKGSTFEITISPPESDQNTIVIHQSDYFTSSKGANLEGLKILVVEDSPDIQVLVSKYLTSAEAKIDMASNGQEGLTKALAEKYDLVLMDISMPILDGFEATTQLRKHGFKKPIIAMSAHAMKEEKDRAIEVGFNDYITKPMNRRLLIEKLSFYGKGYDLN